MRKGLLWLVLILLGLISGVILTQLFQNRYQLRTNDQAILLEQQIKKVCKLVTVEGNYVEHYDYNDPLRSTYEPWFLMPGIVNYKAFIPQKSARLRIKAKVLVGYDLEKIRVETFPNERKIMLSSLPEPSVISIEHDIDYFDKDDSIFRPIDEQDFLAMSKGAKAKIEEIAVTDELLQDASKQGNELLELINFMVQNAGWELVYADDIRPVKKKETLPN